MTKTTRGAMAAAALVLLLSGCASDNSEASGKSAKEVKAASKACADAGKKSDGVKGKKFNIGSNPGQNYYDFVDEAKPDKVIGLEPDLIAAVADCTGFKYTYQKQDFNGLVPAAAAGRIQMITSGMYATPERAKQVNFVSYMKAAEAAVVQGGNPKGITSLDKLCGTTVAQQVGTVEVEIAGKENAKCKAAGKPAIKFINFTNNNQLVQSLTGKRADVFLTDAGVAAYLAKQFEGKLDKGFDIVSDFKFGIGVTKGNPQLLDAIYESLTALHDSGDLAKIAVKWGFTEQQVVKPEKVTG